MHTKALAFLTDHGLSALLVNGKSMQPLLPQGSTVTVFPRQPRLGDIVVFQRGDDLIIHRVVLKWGGRIYTMGDNTRALDPALREGDIIGTVTGIRRRLLPTLRGMLKTLWSAIKSRTRRYI